MKCIYIYIYIYTYHIYRIYHPFINLGCTLVEGLKQIFNPDSFVLSIHICLMTSWPSWQVTAALRNMADLSESRPSFLSSDVFSKLCTVMDHHQEDQDICLNIARIFRWEMWPHIQHKLCGFSTLVFGHHSAESIRTFDFCTIIATPHDFLIISQLLTQRWLTC